jgi:hypothetical protein
MYLVHFFPLLVCVIVLVLIRVRHCTCLMWVTVHVLARVLECTYPYARLYLSCMGDCTCTRSCTRLYFLVCVTVPVSCAQLHLFRVRDYTFMYFVDEIRKQT